MPKKIKLKNYSFLVYGLGSTGNSVIRYFKKNKISKYFIWDDNNTIRKKFKKKKTINLKETFKKVDFIVLSPGISLRKTKNKKELLRYRKKIISDIDLLYLSGKKFKSIVVTGTNGKSTTAKIIEHLLKRNKFKVQLGGNIGTPVLNLNIKENSFVVIEASSFHLSYSKFILPDYALLLNITNDHLDWHGSLQDYKKSKLNLFKLQTKKNFAFINNKFKKNFRAMKFESKLVPLQQKQYVKIKSKIKNLYLKSEANDENMSFVFTLAKKLRIRDKIFVKSMKSFSGLPHRYEIFLKSKNVTFINDSKATSFQATKFALASCKNIYWILGGLHKDKDKLELKEFRGNIVKSYIIGKNVNFFKSCLKKNNVNFSISKNLKKSVLNILKDIKLFKRSSNIVLLSPSAASFDQFDNFEERGNEFKQLCRTYAKKFI
ncbi:UDP-N-acetylmuramoyl-L-alanine--D-glutamate ligase [Candidatus Pelagibacter bacterium]|nr:UDP-N-acetylmuramoyl-L-alanine--D-glutamate ligase [Candidatus Pelagibacter bacterium]|tara:strand:+ start:169 stop:1464 length:1296 start_codon:yes stop_codon:yes gene_type:complete